MFTKFLYQQLDNSICLLDFKSYDWNLAQKSIHYTHIDLTIILSLRYCWWYADSPRRQFKLPVSSTVRLRKYLYLGRWNGCFAPHKFGKNCISSHSKLLVITSFLAHLKLWYFLFFHSRLNIFPTLRCPHMKYILQSKKETPWTNLYI